MTDPAPETDAWDTREVERAYRLPDALSWIPGESILGLLVRNTRPQGFYRPHLLLSRLMRERYIDALGVRHLGDDEAQAVADLLGMDRVSFDLMHHGSSESNTARLFGHVVHAEYVSLARRRACPACLRESPHHRSIWDFSLLTVCPEHGTPLVDRCPSCPKFLNWNTPSVTTCSSLSCGVPLDGGCEVSGPAPQACGPAPAGVRKLVAAIVGSRPLDAPDWPVNSLIRFCFELGCVATGRKGQARPIAFAREHPVLVPEVLDAGWDAIADWPTGFNRLMTDLRAKSGSRRGRWGLKKEFGSLSALVEKLAEDASARPVVDAFSAYVAAEPDLATRARGILRQRSDDQNADRYITASAAKDILEVSYPRFAQMADTFGLWRVAATGKGASSLVDRERLLQLAGSFGGAVTKRGAARLLDVSKGTFRDIEGAGLLRTIPFGQRIAPERLYLKIEVQGLLDRLEAQVAPAPAPVPSATLVTADVLARGGLSIAGILAAILDAKLRPRRIDGGATGVHRLLFDPAWIHGTLSPAAATMSTMAAAVTLGVKQQVAYHWVRRGLIATTVGTTKTEQGYRVSQEALDAFRKKYVTGTEIARQLGRRARWLSVELVRSGINPVSSPEVDGCRQFLFRWADVRAAYPIEIKVPVPVMLPTSSG